MSTWAFCLAQQTGSEKSSRVSWTLPAQQAGDAGFENPPADESGDKALSSLAVPGSPGVGKGEAGVGEGFPLPWGRALGCSGLPTTCGLQAADPDSINTCTAGTAPSLSSIHQVDKAELCFLYVLMALIPAGIKRNCLVD